MTQRGDARFRGRVTDELKSPTVVARMQSEEVRMLFALLVRQRGLLLSAMAEMPPTMFSAIGEAGPWLFLTALYDYFSRHASTPPAPVFDLECRRIIAERAAIGQPLVGYEWAIETIHMAHTDAIATVAADHPNYGLELLTRFLGERLVSDAIVEMSRQTPGHMAYANVSGVIDRLTALNTRVQAVRGSQTYSAMPAVEELANFKMPRIIPTGVDFLDQQVFVENSGCEAGKVYGLLGPYGSFKTGLGVQIFTSSAKAQQGLSEPGLCVYFVYEGGRSEIQLRATAQLAQMPKGTVETFFRRRGDPSVFSTSNNLKPYEVARYDAFNIPQAARLGEAERYAEAQRFLPHLVIVDMSGSPGNESAGSGYIPEIAQYLDRITREKNMPIRMVVVDYVKRLCVRHLQARQLSMDRHLRELVSPMPDTIRRLVADKFDCAVWLLQQLNADANKRAPGAAQHHADAAEGRDFAENLWYCLTLSNPDRANNNTLQLAVTKSRDSAAPPSGIVVRIDGDRFALVRDTDHTIGPRGGIVVTRFHEQVFGVSPPPAAPPPPAEATPAGETPAAPPPPPTTQPTPSRFEGISELDRE